MLLDDRDCILARRCGASAGRYVATTIRVNVKMQLNLDFLGSGISVIRDRISGDPRDTS